MKYDIIIVGAGAAGLVTAYEISRHNQHLRILVLEKEKNPGRKLSASGNGKCNLTNACFDISAYFSKDTDFIQKFISRHNYKEVLAFFQEMGIFLYEKEGYYYPVSNQGKQVTDILYTKCMKQGVEFVLNASVTAVMPDNGDRSGIGSYIVKATKRREKETVSQKAGKGKKSLPVVEESTVCYQAERVILCTGGMAAPKLGGSNTGYAIADKLGLKQERIVPVLTPAYVADSDLKVAKGVRLETVITLRKNGELIAKESGQLQINEDNMSGIAIMNLSCFFNQFSMEERRECLQMDVFPYMTFEELKVYFERQQRKVPKESVIMIMEGLFPVKFGEYLLRKTGIHYDMPVGKLTDKQINRLTSLIKKMVVTPIEHSDFDKAQVTAGGVCMEEVCEDGFECRRYPGLFVLGELLDVNGKCGGYNLTFAILSGIQAAHCILKEIA